MKFIPTDPPRRFKATGAGLTIELSDCGRMALEPNEQVTFVANNGGEYDVARKSWGYYATPSTNGRLARFGFKTALVLNAKGQLFVMLVEQGGEEDFNDYIREDRQRVLCWLDDDREIEQLKNLFGEEHGQPAK
ncbi:MAG: hypothetical protein HQL63_07690 [Magnetococcales bacterium]|nr:hypothetical protein [Magnetococcales bacterium]MBF0321484.1 hypothetical protein [Magnetococcales bacterium]